MPRTLAEIALDAGLLSKADAARAGRLADERGEPLIAVIVRELGVDEVALLGAIRRQTRTPVADPGEVRPEADALGELTREACRRLRVLPLALSHAGGARILRLAMADPTDGAAIAEVEHVTGCEIEVTLLPLSAIEELAEEGYRAVSTSVDLSRPRVRRRFGDDLAPTTQLHTRPASGEETVEVPTTVPHHLVSDEADAALRVRALVHVLVAKGVITEDEYEESVKDLLKLRHEEP